MGDTEVDYFIKSTSYITEIERIDAHIVEVKALKYGKEITPTYSNNQMMKHVSYLAKGATLLRSHSYVTTGGVKTRLHQFTAGLFGVRAHHFSARYSGSLKLKNINFKQHY